MAARKGNTSLQDLKNFISLNKGHIIYLSGEEEFFVEESLDHIRRTFLDPFSQDFNYDLFYGRETEASKVFDVIETLPMMAQKRLVIVRQAHELRDQDWKTLMPAIDNPVESTFLVFAGKKPDSRKSTIKQVFKNTTLLHFNKPYDNEYSQWVQYICKKHKITIDRDAIQLFIQIVGSNLLELQNEILKVSQFVGGKGHISAADVMSVASRIKLQSIFDLTKAIGESDKARALMCLAQLLESGQNEVGILTMIHRHIRLLRQTKVGEQQGYNGRELSSFAGVPHFFLNEYRRQSQLWSERKIEKTYKVLLDTDKALKSSPISSHIWLENFVMQTCN